MKVTFDKNIRIAGIGLVPWPRLGPERWLPQYKIASLYDWDLTRLPGAREVIASSSSAYGVPELDKQRSQDLIDSTQFQQLLTDKLPGYDFITYKPVIPPRRLLNAGFRFLSVNQALTQTLENKAAFRENFADLGLPFPAYKIMSRCDIMNGTVSLKDILSGREAVILQDESLDGGRGTFVVSDDKSLQYATESITRLGGEARVVISELIPNAFERSVQCCATRYGTFVGPLQKQIIGHPLLANLEAPDGDRFCGAEISRSDPLQSNYHEIEAYALKIGDRLCALGYRGIFSLDCLVDKAGKMYVLEINPRLTGITPLLTMLYREGHDIPFYLLHMLETAGLPYKITDDFVDPVQDEGSLLILHSPAKTWMDIADAPNSGTYDLNTLAFKEAAYQLDGNAAHLLVQRYTPPGFRLKPGGRLLSILTRSRALDDADRLRPDMGKAAETFLDQITLKEVAL